MNERRVLVIADDLTSAAEVAGWMASAQGALVQLSPDQEPVLLSADRGCVVTGTRGMTAEDSADVMRTVVRNQIASGVKPAGLMIIKTMDSSLRGNWAAELAALMEAFSISLAVVAAAFPAYSRVTVGGVQLVDDRPVHLSPAGSDPVSPVRDSTLRAHLVRAGLAVAEVGRPSADDGSRLDEALRTRWARPTALVVDATTDEDLRVIARRAESDPSVLWCAGPGLAAALVADIEHDAVVSSPGDAALAIVGSLHPVSRGQVEYARNMGTPVVTVHESTADDASVRVQAALLQQGRAILCSPETPLVDWDRVLGAVARDVVERIPRAGLVLTGGDTALAVAHALGARTLSIHGEWAPGIPFGRLSVRHAPGVVTKAGGFGGPDTLVRLLDAMTIHTAQERVHSGTRSE